MVVFVVVVDGCILRRMFVESLIMLFSANSERQIGNAGR